MQNATINTDSRIYLIKFSFRLSGGKYIFTNANELVKLLKENDKTGIEYIKTFDPVKDKFARISKSDFLQFNNWQTEAMQFLQNHYYFKK
jgi:hypothetical protein